MSSAHAFTVAVLVEDLPPNQSSSHTGRRRLQARRHSGKRVQGVTLSMSKIRFEYSAPGLLAAHVLLREEPDEDDEEDDEDDREEEEEEEGEENDDGYSP